MNINSHPLHGSSCKDEEVPDKMSNLHLYHIRNNAQSVYNTARQYPHRKSEGLADKPRHQHKSGPAENNV